MALNLREGEIIRQFGTLNKRIAGRTQKEWEQDNKEKKREYNQIYQEKTDETVLARLLALEEKLAQTEAELI